VWVLVEKKKPSKNETSNGVSFGKVVWGCGRGGCGLGEGERVEGGLGGG